MTYTLDSTLFTLGTYSSYTTFNSVNLNKYTTNYEVEFISLSSSGADAFAQVFLNNTLCDSTGASAPTFTTGVSWAIYQNAYSKLDSSIQTVLQNATANASGSNIENAMARYDLICRKYTSFTNFIGRSSANPSNRTLIKLFDNQALMISLMITCSSVVIALATILIIKRRKRAQLENFNS